MPGVLNKSRLKQGKPFAGQNIKEIIIAAGRKQLYNPEEEKHTDEDSNSVSNRWKEPEKINYYHPKVIHEPQNNEEEEEQIIVEPPPELAGKKRFSRYKKRRNSRGERNNRRSSADVDTISILAGEVEDATIIHSPHQNKDDDTFPRRMSITSDTTDFGDLLPTPQPNNNVSTPLRRFSFATDSSDFSSSDLSYAFNKLLEEASVESEDISRQIALLAEECDSYPESVAERQIEELYQQIEEERHRAKINFQEDFLGIPKDGPLADDSDEENPIKPYEFSLEPTSRFMQPNGRSYFITKRSRRNLRNKQQYNNVLDQEDAELIPQYNILRRGIFEDDPIGDDSNSSDEEEEEKPKAKPAVISRFLKENGQELDRAVEARRKRHKEKLKHRERINPLIYPNFAIIK